MLIKYPKTLHLPWSESLQNDDRMMLYEDVIKNFSNNDVVITEKLDGENTSMYSDHIHARSLDSQYHPSRSWVKGLHGSIKYLIPDFFIVQPLIITGFLYLFLINQMNLRSNRVVALQICFLMRRSLIAG